MPKVQPSTTWSPRTSGSGSAKPSPSPASTHQWPPGLSSRRQPGHDQHEVVEGGAELVLGTRPDVPVPPADREPELGQQPARRRRSGGSSSRAAPPRGGPRDARRRVHRVGPAEHDRQVVVGDPRDVGAVQLAQARRAWPAAGRPARAAPGSPRAASCRRPLAPFRPCRVDPGAAEPTLGVSGGRTYPISGLRRPTPGCSGEGRRSVRDDVVVGPWGCGRNASTLSSTGGRVPATRRRGTGRG